MLKTLFATKGAMTQAWTKQGKRLPITKCLVDQNIVLGTQKVQITDKTNTTFRKQPCLIFEIGYGKKKLKNISKPLRTQIKKSGFSFGFKQIEGIKLLLNDETQEKAQEIKPGHEIAIDQVLEVGDMVQVQGISKGRGFAGVMKRHNMKGGPRTRGQSDRPRAIGSIGAATYPGRVLPGKRMPGHYGSEKVTVRNLTVVHIDLENKEVWLSGPVPGHLNSILRIKKTGKQNNIELDKAASGIKELEKKVEEKSKKKQASTEEKKEEKQQEPQQEKKEDKKQETKPKKDEKKEKKADKKENTKKETK